MQSVETVRRWRFRYRLAWGLMLLLTFVVMFGSYLMPHGITPEHKIALHSQEIDGVMKKVSPPLAPNSEFWFGTDHRGYDVLSLLLNGAKYTLCFALLATVLRFVIALPLGLYSGATGRGRSALATLHLVTSSVPALLFLFPTMYGLNSMLPPESTGRILFALVVGIGVFQIANQFAQRADFYSGKLYIEASRTLGASTSRIVFRHFVPHLRPEILFAFLSEFVQVLFLLGQLAVVRICLGGGEWLVIDDGPPMVRIMLTTSGEWGGMISYGISTLRSYPWILGFSGLVFTVSVLILSFFAKQVQKRLDAPHLYVDEKPLRKNKPLVGSIAVGAALCVALLVGVGMNKSPLPSPDSVAKVSEMSPQTGKSAPASAPTGGMKADEPDIKKAKQRAESFINYLIKNKWETAALYAGVDYDIFAKGNKKEVPPPPPPYDLWLKAFTEQNYQFLGFGAVRLWGNHVELEIKVKNASGNEEVWYLMHTTSGSIREASGGPGIQGKSKGTQLVSE